MRVLAGEEPRGCLVTTRGLHFHFERSHAEAEWLPRHWMFSGEHRMPNGGRIDIFGRRVHAHGEHGRSSAAHPGKYILDDITKWRDVIKVPSWRLRLGDDRQEVYREHRPQ
jgi:hypothetical protein